MMEYRPSRKRKIAGWTLLSLGVIGFVMPVLQGALFTALGLFVLRHQYLWAHRGTDWASRRWPQTVGKVEELEARIIARMEDWMGRARRLLGRA